MLMLIGVGIGIDLEAVRSIDQLIGSHMSVGYSGCVCVLNGT